MNMTPLSGSNKIVVVGGGAAGMMAAGMRLRRRARGDAAGAERPARQKSFITGKGRCNVTNDCPWQDVLQSVPTNPGVCSSRGPFRPQTQRNSLKITGRSHRARQIAFLFPDRSQSVLVMRSRTVPCVHTMCVSCRAKRRRSPFPWPRDRRKTAEGPVPADCVISRPAALSASRPLAGLAAATPWRTLGIRS